MPFTFGTHKTCTRHVYNLENLVIAAYNNHLWLHDTRQICRQLSTLAGLHVSSSHRFCSASKAFFMPFSALPLVRYLPSPASSSLMFSQSLS